MNDQTATAGSSIDGGASALTVRLEDAWSRSLVEEVISVLWAIAAILCFGFGFNVAGWCFAIKAILDTGTSIFFAVVEAIREHKDKSSNVPHEGPSGASREGHLDAVVGGLRDGADLDAE